MRLEPTIALAWKQGEAAHPQLSAGAGTARWEGYLNLLRPGAYQFSALLRGKFRLLLDGQEVFRAEAAEEAAQLKSGPAVWLEAGVHALTAEFTRLPGNARLELFWQAPYFHREPLAQSQLGHLPARAPAQLASHQLVERGRFLAEELNCTRCHRPDDSDRMAKGLQTRQAPDLSKIGQRVYAGWMERWLANPRKLQPSALMPQCFSDDETGRMERTVVSHYLASLGGPLQPDTRKPRRQDIQRQSQRGERLFTSVGCLACHGEEKSKDARTTPLTGLGSKTTPERLSQYLQNPLAIDPSGRMPHMLLQGDEARSLSIYLCQSTLPDVPLTLRVALPAGHEAHWLDVGKRLVLSKGCTNCHALAPGGKPLTDDATKLPFSDIKKPENAGRGCMAPDREHAGKAPWFALSQVDRESLRVFLLQGTSGAGSPAPAHAARVALERFNCLACHVRDGHGGLTSSLVERLRQVERAENAEAISPPPLTGVAHKLRTPWMRQVLAHAGRARPWMGLRMPQFGEANVGWLPAALAALEGTEPDETVHQVKLNGAKVGAGRQLVGKSAFGCISCHDIAGIANRGTRGPDLSLMDQRVRYEWYRLWLEQAQRMQPGTRMPEFFPHGKSTLSTVLGGDADAQAEAIWAYLSLGPGLPLPEGLEPPPGLVLAVKDRPILLRTFMPDAGARAMAVGYPGGVSIAFDAATCRLTYAWSGAFLDASPVWNDRGGNPAKVLGSRFWTAPPGCSWAVTTSSAPDFTALARDPAYGAGVPEGEVYQGPRRLSFLGYAVDKAGMPAFRYRVQSAEGLALEIRERPEPLPHALAVGLTRHFHVTALAQSTPWLCAAQTERDPRVLDLSKGALLPLDLKSGTLEIPAAGHLLLLRQPGERLAALELSTASQGVYWTLRREGNTWRALARLPGSAERMEWDLDIHIWIVPRDDLNLLKELHAGK
jgi:mono/diheme cytochrome c family protein